MVQTRAIQLLNAVLVQQEAVRNHPHQTAMLANPRNQAIEIGVQKRFAAAERNDAGPESRQHIDPPQHLIHRDGFREIVVFIAVCAGEIAAPGRNNMSQHRMVRGTNTVEEHAPFAQAAICGKQTSPEVSSVFRHIRETNNYYNISVMLETVRRMSIQVLIAMRAVECESRVTNRDIFRAVRLRRAVSNPLSFRCKNGLARMHVENSLLGFHPQSAVQHHGIFIEIRRLAGFYPAAGTCA